MTVYVRYGRNVPKLFYKRLWQRLKGWITFQEELWQMINMSLNKARNAAKKDGSIIFNVEKTTEKDEIDDKYVYEWIEVIIQGNNSQEKEEYNEAMEMYQKLIKEKGKKIPKYEATYLRKIMNKINSSKKHGRAYKAGEKEIKKSNMANKLLEMGILTDVEWVKEKKQ